MTNQQLERLAHAVKLLMAMISVKLETNGAMTRHEIYELFPEAVPIEAVDCALGCMTDCNIAAFNFTINKWELV